MSKLLHWGQARNIVLSRENTDIWKQEKIAPSYLTLSIILWDSVRDNTRICYWFPLHVIGSKKNRGENLRHAMFWQILMILLFSFSLLRAKIIAFSGNKVVQLCQIIFFDRELDRSLRNEFFPVKVQRLLSEVKISTNINFLVF